MKPRALDRLTFGGRVPAVVGVLLVLTVLLSCAAAVSAHAGVGLGGILALVPERVLGGEVHRVLTWAFIETSPLQLLFDLLLVYWLGRDLVGLWGERRFALVWVGITVLAALVTCALSSFLPQIRMMPYVGSLAVVEALLVGWGLSFPDRVIRIYFVLPVRGTVIAWGSLAITIAFAIYAGIAAYVPALAASALMLAYVYLPLSRLRTRSAPRRPQAKPRAPSRRRAAANHLRVIEGGDRADAPLTPEMQATLDRLFGRGAPKKPS